MLDFEFSHPRALSGPLSLRADYCLELSIGRGLGVLTDLPPQRKGERPWPNQAGIFADATYPLVTIGTIFFLAEKPLKKEVMGYGYIRGRALREEAEAKKFPYKLCWDNIHQWGASREGLPTTPGAAHAAHCHWRWTPTAASGSFFMRLVGAEPQEYFGGLFPGGPLIDSEVSNQTLRFAITAGLHTAAFKRLYEKQKDPFDELSAWGPLDVEDGATLATWFVIEASSDLQLGKKWRGGLFKHGVYFAHGVEDVGTHRVAAGLQGPLYKPEGSVTEWKRPQRYPQ
jgi:hypothetical protein